MYYLIIGATCAGKDKIANYITDNYEGFKMIVSTTSRPIRPKEQNGVEYYFVSREEFNRMLGNDEFIEYRTYNTIVNGISDTWYYGLEKKNVGDASTNYVAVMDYQGATEFVDYIGKENVVLLYVRSLYSERYLRNILRGDFNIQEWARRNNDDLNWLTHAKENADVIINNYGVNIPVSKRLVDSNTDIPEFFENLRNFDGTITQIETIINKYKKEIK